MGRDNIQRVPRHIIQGASKHENPRDLEIYDPRQMQQHCKVAFLFMRNQFLQRKGKFLPATEVGIYPETTAMDKDREPFFSLDQVESYY